MNKKPPNYQNINQTTQNIDISNPNDNTTRRAGLLETLKNTTETMQRFQCLQG